jgi:5-methylcytosine-specific restriction endonuclease McrA
VDEIYATIVDVFNGRCALCPKHYDCFHEIVPKSRRKNWHTLDNTVTLCKDCHEKVHRDGTSNYRDQLQSILDKKLNAKNS